LPESQQPTAGTVELYRWLRLARSLDLELCKLSSRWFPARGEEAVIVGSFCDLRATDIVAPHYRDPFVVYLMRGAELWRLVAQVLAKPDGYNKGRSVPFTGPFKLNIVPWVAGDLGTSIGVATGASLALRTRANNDVVVCTFGEGAANRGDLHESLNLAALWRLPIVFVCQNNGWAISQPVSSYLPAPVVARAAGYGIPGVQVDGQDVEEVREAVARAVVGARNGEGPTLIEALTLRGAGHWAGDTEDYRDRSAERAVPDPVDLFRSRLVERGWASFDELREVDSGIEQSVLDAVSKALAARDISPRDLATDDVFA
jgi:acetoin:2,6-dichlorophenolindophenol oxidoreductase subunit alpha